jgi:cyanate permease
MGVIEIGWVLGAACGPAVAGYVFDIAGSYSYAFLGGGVAVLLSSVLIQLIRMPKRET